MVVKVYVSGISGNKEVKKRQQRVLMILESKGVACDIVDITEPGKETDKEFMQKNSKLRDENDRHPLPPQLFNDDEYCGDYDDFDLSNEIDKLEEFLKVPRVNKNMMQPESVGNGVNGVPGSREASAERVTEVVTEVVTSETTEEESNKTAPAEEPIKKQTPAEVEEEEEEEEEEEAEGQE